MSPHLHYEIARARQQEIAARTIRPDLQFIAGPHLTLGQRINQAVAALATRLPATSPRTQIWTP